MGKLAKLIFMPGAVLAVTACDLPNFGNGVTVQPWLWCDLPRAEAIVHPEYIFTTCPSRTEVTGAACSTLLM